MSTRENHFDYETRRAMKAVKAVCDCNPDMKASYDLYLEESLEAEGATLTKGIDLQLFAHVQALVDMISQLEEKLEAQEEELKVMNTLFNKLLNKYKNITVKGDLKHGRRKQIIC